MTHTVRVSYAKRGDHFIASSEDLRGLFVAHPSLAVVYEEVPEAIKILFRVKYSMTVDVKETTRSPDKISIQELVYEAEETQMAA